MAWLQALVGGDSLFRPVVSEAAAPLEVIRPQASDEPPTIAVLRKPPGKGPFPAVIYLHGGTATFSLERLQEAARGNVLSRYLAAGYVTVAATFRPRTKDPLSPATLRDGVAIVDFVKRFPHVDPESVVIWGTSGGGDLALQLAAEVRLAAIAAEEPATIMFTGIWTKDSPKKGEIFTAKEADEIMKDPHRFYTPEHARLTRERIARIQCPIFIGFGGVALINRINSEIFIPELVRANKTLVTAYYPAEEHGFSRGPGTRAGTTRFFQDCSAFFLRYLKTKPRAVPASLVRMVPVVPNSSF
jgi:dienelactone hydrolase